MAGATQIRTPDKVRALQIALYRKAKAEPQYRFWSLYGERLRPDVLNAALDARLENGGEAGVDGEELAAINASPEVRQQWLNRLQAELRNKKVGRPCAENCGTSSTIGRCGVRPQRWWAKPTEYCAAGPAISTMATARP